MWSPPGSNFCRKCYQPFDYDPTKKEPEPSNLKQERPHTATPQVAEKPKPQEASSQQPVESKEKPVQIEAMTKEEEERLYKTMNE